MSFAPTDIERMREKEQQHGEEKEKLKRLSLESDIGRAQAVETEVQNRLGATEEYYKKEISALQADLARSKATEANGRLTIDNLAQQVHELQEQLNQSQLLEARHAQLGEELQFTNHSLAQKKVGILEQRVVWYFDQNSELETERDALKAQNDLLKTQKRELKGQKNAKDARLKEIEATLAQTKTQNADLQATLGDILDDAAREAEKLKAAKAACSQAEASLAQERDEKAKLEGECRRLRRESSLLLEEVEDLTEVCRKLRTKRTRSRRK